VRYGAPFFTYHPDDNSRERNRRAILLHSDASSIRRIWRNKGFMSDSGAVVVAMRRACMQQYRPFACDCSFTPVD
jgi:hypothetical protein